jgi:hypothetical protein
MEIELVPDPGPEDPAARAALSALARELARSSGGGSGWGLVPHSGEWRAAAVRDAVGRAEGLQPTDGNPESL